jgi:hypothetical protein
MDEFKKIIVSIINKVKNYFIPADTGTGQIGGETFQVKKGWYAKTKKFIPVIMIVLYLALAWVGYYYYRQATDLKKNPQRQQAILQQEADSLVAAVGRLIVLPTDEQPTIATVSDPEKLRNEAFFSAAKSGDKVLIYSKAKKAILYDPIADKIVEVAPLNINLNTQ